MVYKIFTILSGIYAFLGGLIWCLMGVASMFAPPEKIADYPAGLSLLVIVFFFFVGLMLIATAVGLFMRKNWARIGLMIFSSFSLIMGVVVILSSIVIFTSNTELPRNALIAVEIFYGIVCIAIPLFFLIFFNRQPVKTLFAVPQKEDAGSGADPEDAPAPLGIKVLAVYYLFCVFSMLVSAGLTMQTKEIPLIVNVLWVSGAGLKMYLAANTLLHLYLGYGFFRLRKTAWKVAMYWNGGALLLGFYNIIFMSQAYLDRMMVQYAADTKFVMTLSQHKMLALISSVIIAGITYYIYRNKKYFVN